MRLEGLGQEMELEVEVHELGCMREIDQSLVLVLGIGVLERGVWAKWQWVAFGMFK